MAEFDQGVTFLKENSLKIIIGGSAGFSSKLIESK
jgi:hypothetical protein